MNMKDKCSLCKENTLGILTKCTLMLNMGFHCKNCRARYIPKKFILVDRMFFGVNFLINVVDLLLTILWFPIIALIVYFFMNSLIIAFILFCLLIILSLLFIKYRPYKLDENDSMNDRIKRIEDAK